jgi:hypothetical protein
VRQLWNLNTKNQPNRVVRIANLCLLGLLLVPMVATERLPASFSSKVTAMTVEIDGVSFGAFSPIKDIERLTGTSLSAESGRVELSRNFVTDPSLYLWANTLMKTSSGLKDVTLISQNADGVEISRHVLQMSQPVSWTVEASNPEVGGLHERVEFAVQKIERR